MRTRKPIDYARESQSRFKGRFRSANMKTPDLPPVETSLDVIRADIKRLNQGPLEGLVGEAKSGRRPTPPLDVDRLLASLEDA